MKNAKVLAAAAALSFCCLVPQRAIASSDTDFESFTQKGTQALAARDYAQAERMFAHALSVSNSFGERDYRLPQAIANLAEAYSEQQKYAESETLYRRLLDLRIRNDGPESLNTSEAYFRLGKILETRRATYPTAVSYFQKDIELKKKKLGAQSPEVMRRIDYLATSFWIHHRYADAIPLYEQSIAESQRRAPDDLQVGFNKEALAQCYAATGNKPRAVALATDALHILEKHYNPSDKRLAEVRAELKGYQSKY